MGPSLRDEYLTMYRSVQVPAAGQVWWRAAVRARLETAEHAARPMTWMQGLAGAGTAGLLVALVGLAWPSVLGYAGWAFTSLLPRPVADPQIAAALIALRHQTVPFLAVIALCFVIAPVAVYLATSDEYPPSSLDMPGRRWHRRRRSGARRICVVKAAICVPQPLRDRLHEAGSEALAEMFADAHRLATESFERRLGDEVGKLRLDIADLRFELLKWSFLFWIGQVAALAGVFSLLLRAMR